MESMARMAALLAEPGASGGCIRLGLAGLGLAGALMARAASREPGVVLAAAADPREAPRQAFARDFGARGYVGIRDLCADKEVDVVYIGTPHQFHAEHAILAAEHGKHVILEKPMALKLDECDAILAAVQRYGVHLLVGHTHAYDPAVRAMRRIVASGWLGCVRMIMTFNYTDFMYRPRRPEELDTALGGGIVFNQIPHQIDIIRMLGGGMLRSVRASCSVLEPRRLTETAAAAFWEFEDGTAATSIYSGADFFNSDEFHDWVGEAGLRQAPAHGNARRLLKRNTQTVEAKLRAQNLAYGAFALPEDALAHPPHFGTTIVTCERGEMRTSPDGLMLYDEEGAHALALPQRTGYEGLFSDLRNALHGGVPARHDGRWGKAGVEAMLALLRSARERREIKLGCQVRMPPGQ